MSLPARAALGLGANLGDRLARLRGAVDTINGEPGVAGLRVSSYYETAPVGGPDQDDFVNAVVVFDTTLTPAQLLKLAHRCEAAAGRERGERWGPRTLDVDVLAYGQMVVSVPELTVPHPRAVERAFVMVPWAEVDPTFVVGGRSVAEWATAVGRTGVRLLDDQVPG
ncbi:MAG: 2-amino-4-hydroxy-6-hydroxymethyldihydropteridine diphosphokinase [Actinomycetes bacterium]